MQEAEDENAIVMYGKVGNKDVSRKLNINRPRSNSAWRRTSAVPPTSSSFIKWCPLLDPQNLVPFFDVSTREVVQRLGYSLVPFHPKFHEIYHAKPDLYGPFWILTTLVTSLFISGNLSRYIRLGKKDFEYNFTIVPFSAGVIYGVGFGLPVLVHSMQKWFGGL